MDNLPAVASNPNLPDRIEYARTLAASNLLPRHYQQRPENVLLAMEYGDALGIPAIQAINSIHVIEGKPTASAELIAALVRRAGHKLRIREEATPDGPQVTATLIRADDPEFEFIAVWDTAKAKAAGLAGKGNWAKYPGQMMRARAITEVCRQAASDALYGVVYTPEEVGGVTVEQIADEPAPAPEPPAETYSPEPTEAITADQRAAMGAAFPGFADMADFAADLIGRKPTGLDDLTADEAALILAAHTAADIIDAELVQEQP